MQQLKPQTTLQGGKYKIVSTLGQGGFGITYLAEQVMLGRKVAIKEFFYKECCDREEGTSHVTLGTQSNRETVQRFMNKFLKEARTISQLEHPNIIKIHDIFEENNTAYYVMEYIDGENLSEMVKRQGALSEVTAVEYIKKVADALSYIHAKSINHLDVKPGNIMLRQHDQQIVLIDFGLSKQYDEVGSQTSSTPLGISQGYAPIEQYRPGGVAQFTPQADIYSLGATLYWLIIGQAPPPADEILDDGLPAMPPYVSLPVKKAIESAMQVKKKDRPQGVTDFLKLLDEKLSAPYSAPTSNDLSLNDEETHIIQTNTQKSEAPNQIISKTNQNEKVKSAYPLAMPPPPMPPRFAAGDTYKKVVSVSNKSESFTKRLIKTCIIVGVLVVAPFIIMMKCGLFSDGDGTDSVSDSLSQLVSYSNGELNVNSVTYKMVSVAGGTFTMGATSEMKGAWEHELPTHKVTLSGFSIGQTEVTQALWKAVMENNPSHFDGDNLPVECVSWDDCNAFLSKLDSMTGKNFRFPTEAEWEFAARGGNNSNHTPYSGSGNINDIAWHKGNSGSKTHPVAQMNANELGIYDMCGNVWEWCSDWYGDYSDKAQTNPLGAHKGTLRVLRGGDFNSDARYCRSSYRTGNKPDFRYNGFGFRICLSN